MRLYVNGRDLETGGPLMPPIDREELGGCLLSTLLDRRTEIARLASSTTVGRSFRAEFERVRTPDLGDPATVGWTILVGAQDPRREEWIEALRPLAEHRGMSDPEQPLVFPRLDEDDWFDWLQESYLAVELERPFYVLIAGGPEHVPFHFQARLDSAAAVGRLDLDTADDVRAYHYGAQYATPSGASPYCVDHRHGAPSR